MLMTSGLCIIGSNGPNTGTLRAARNSSAAFFCSGVYCSGAMVGRRCCANAGPATIIAPANKAQDAAERSMSCLLRDYDWKSLVRFFDCGPAGRQWQWVSTRDLIRTGSLLMCARCLVTGALDEALEPDEGGVGMHNDVGRNGREIIVEAALGLEFLAKLRAREVVDNARRDAARHEHAAAGAESQRHVAGHGAEHGAEHVERVDAHRTAAIER